MVYIVYLPKYNGLHGLVILIYNGLNGPQYKGLHGLVILIKWSTWSSYHTGKYI